MRLVKSWCLIPLSNSDRTDIYINMCLRARWSVEVAASVRFRDKKAPILYKTLVYKYDHHQNWYQAHLELKRAEESADELKFPEGSVTHWGTITVTPPHSTSRHWSHDCQKMFFLSFAHSDWGFCFAKAKNRTAAFNFHKSADTHVRWRSCTTHVGGITS